MATLLYCGEGPFRSSFVDKRGFAVDTHNES